MTSPTTRIGALVAILALAMAPAARAGCAARCAAPARPASAPVDGAGASHQHAHHHRPGAGATPTPEAAVRDTHCGPFDGGRGCLVVRDTLVAPTGRVLQDTVSLAIHPASTGQVVPLAAACQAHRTPPIRPPGFTAASLPLRI